MPEVSITAWLLAHQEIIRFRLCLHFLVKRPVSWSQHAIPLDLFLAVIALGFVTAFLKADLLKSVHSAASPFLFIINEFPNALANHQQTGAYGSLVGLDQINLLLPRGLTGMGPVDVAINVDGLMANVVKINVK